MIDDKPSSHEERAPHVELKPLLTSSRYKFLGPNSTYHVIQVEYLLRVLRMHHKPIECTTNIIVQVDLGD